MGTCRNTERRVALPLALQNTRDQEKAFVPRWLHAIMAYLHTTSSDPDQLIGMMIGMGNIEGAEKNGQKLQTFQGVAGGDEEQVIIKSSVFFYFTLWWSRPLPRVCLVVGRRICLCQGVCMMTVRCVVCNGQPRRLRKSFLAKAPFSGLVHFFFFFFFFFVVHFPHPLFASVPRSNPPPLPFFPPRRYLGAFLP